MKPPQRKAGVKGKKGPPSPFLFSRKNVELKQSPFAIWCVRGSSNFSSLVRRGKGFEFILFFVEVSGCRLFHFTKIELKCWRLTKRQQKQMRNISLAKELHFWKVLLHDTYVFLWEYRIHQWVLFH